MAHVVVKEQVASDRTANGGWRLYLQWCTYHLDDGIQEGYRFIWRRPDVSLQAARGQARIPSLNDARDLMEKAASAGWGDHNGLWPEI